jgi:hypothetical protein
VSFRLISTSGGKKSALGSLIQMRPTLNQFEKQLVRLDFECV